MSNDKPNEVILNDQMDNTLRSPTSAKDTEETKQAKATSDIIKTSNETEDASLRKVTLLDIINYYNFVPLYTIRIPSNNNHISNFSALF
jgi:hypothetical protein